MAQAEIQEVLSVDKDRLFDVITRYEDYPKFVDGCSSVNVERKGPGNVRVTYSVNLMKEISYTLDHVENREAGTVEWKLVSSEFLKGNSGSWRIQSAGTGKSSVSYSIDIDFKFPVPGFVLSKLVKGSLPSMLKNFEKKAKSS